MALSLSVAALATACSSAEPTRQDEESIHECLGTSQAAVKVCASGPTLKGIDVSYYELTVDWPKVKGSGQSFAFVRVSDGIDYPDSKFAQNWPAVKAVGILRGAYQFFRPTKDVTAQVNLFTQKIDAAGGLLPGDLPPVLDLESSGNLPGATVVARAKEWLAQVEARYGVKPIVYTSAAMSEFIGTNFSAHTLWVANYETTCPTMPSGWTKWAFWQHSEKGTVPGVPTDVDMNVFNGTHNELNALTLKAGTAAAPASPSNTTIDDASIDGYQGETIGSGTSGTPRDPQATPPAPCR